ncbi:alpha-2,8-polysialyltransferase family protein [Testudinibacter sp. TR-2022]|uniref:alpha-2,8-polysialyltransferase family protein n=1 Tax=Testudinibacter sp. TR-2022 TaxID=2585029 RepID=UPI001118F3D8|nr:alpha-2,8-polysialyltransferase family protein [Testudinibacter sp. TR-2022]TNH22273.1 hypothetical protein FHQ29_07960 [Testudinibacter sp. TR-2022]
MSKLKKLLINPIRFFKDSWVFFSSNISKIQGVQNLFVISHLGQLGQVEALIIKENFKKNSLIILYTNKNLKMPNVILEKVNSKLFIQIELLRLPLAPNVIDLKKIINLNCIYSKLLNKISPKELFILSFEKHYCLLAARASDANININLVEEGTATYKYGSYESAIETLYSNLNKNEKKVALLINKFSLFSPLRPVLKIHTDFKNGYICFPELLSNVFNIRNVSYFFVHENGGVINKYIENIKKSYKISCKDIIFLNQRYPFPKESYANILVDILDNYTKKLNVKAFIKLHPKDSLDIKHILENKIKNIKSSSIYLIDNPDFLVEPLIFLVKPKIILSLTSTSLVYTKFLSKETSAISCYPIIRKRLLKLTQDMLSPNKFFQEADEHFSILTKFDNVQIAYEDKDIINILNR